MTPDAGIALAAALREALERGEPPPCAGPYRDAWTSDDADARAAAAELCNGCPIFTECGQAANSQRERWGVWAGRDRSIRVRQESVA